MCVELRIYGFFLSRKSGEDWLYCRRICDMRSLPPQLFKAVDARGCAECGRYISQQMRQYRVWWICEFQFVDKFRNFGNLG